LEACEQEMRIRSSWGGEIIDYLAAEYEDRPVESSLTDSLLNMVSQRHIQQAQESHSVVSAQIAQCTPPLAQSFYEAVSSKVDVEAFYFNHGRMSVHYNICGVPQITTSSVPHELASRVQLRKEKIPLILGGLFIQIATRVGKQFCAEYAVTMEKIDKVMLGLGRQPQSQQKKQTALEKMLRMAQSPQEFSYILELCARACKSAVFMDCVGTTVLTQFCRHIGHPLEDLTSLMRAAAFSIPVAHSKRNQVRDHVKLEIPRMSLKLSRAVKGGKYMWEQSEVTEAPVSRLTTYVTPYDPTDIICAVWFLMPDKQIQSMILRRLLPYYLRDYGMNGSNPLHLAGPFTTSQIRDVQERLVRIRSLFSAPAIRDEVELTFGNGPPIGLIAWTNGVPRYVQGSTFLPDSPLIFSCAQTVVHGVRCRITMGLPARYLTLGQEVESYELDIMSGPFVAVDGVYANVLPDPIIMKMQPWIKAHRKMPVICFITLFTTKWFSTRAFRVTSSSYHDWSRMLFSTGQTDVAVCGDSRSVHIYGRTLTVNMLAGMESYSLSLF